MIETEHGMRWAERLADARSRRVVFVSHCLLNQNVRYLGGAFERGVVRSAVADFVEQGIGICQMPCPEQIAWGGVTKRMILRFYGSKQSLLYRLRGVLLPAFLAYTRWRYRRIARRIARDMADYVRSGFEIVGVVGVGESPSCGVARTLDMRRALPVVASLDVATVEPSTFDERVIRACVVAGSGMFVEALREAMVRAGLSVALSEHDPVLPRTG